MRIYIVQGEHPYVPGIVMEAFRSEASAMSKAIDLVDSMLQECGLRVDVAASLEDRLDILHDDPEHDNDAADVWITELELED